MGVTDVDDKIIRRAAEEGRPPAQLARIFEDRFFQDMASLNVRPPEVRLRVTDHIDQIRGYVEKLEDEGFAYSSASGVYFDVRAFVRDLPLQEEALLGSSAPPGQGNLLGAYAPFAPRLSQETGEDIMGLGGADKRDSRDFALWKFRGKDEGEWTWPSR